MANVGLDIGSTATKCVLSDGARFVYYMTPTAGPPPKAPKKPSAWSAAARTYSSATTYT